MLVPPPKNEAANFDRNEIVFDFGVHWAHGFCAQGADAGHSGSLAQCARCNPSLGPRPPAEVNAAIRACHCRSLRANPALGQRCAAGERCENRGQCDECDGRTLRVVAMTGQLGVKRPDLISYALVLIVVVVLGEAVLAALIW
jgi:hypothetical protein